MIKLLSAVVLLLSLPMTVGCSQGDTNADQALIQGTWKTTRMATDGKDLPEETIAKTTTVTFEGDKMITKRKEKVLETWTFKLDPSKSPKQMTVNRAKPSEEEKLSLLIYKIEGDTLTTLSGSRSFPTEFTTNTVKGCYLTVRQRIEE